MIIDRTPISMNDVGDILKDLPESLRKDDMDLFLKKFLKTKPEQAKKIKDGLNKLDILKIKDEHIVKIIDFLPGDASDLIKIFVDVSLNEDETNKILNVVKSSGK
jgi:DNA-directed RNA polymerase subunit F